MSHEWAMVDEWKSERLRRNAKRQLSACTDSVWHARMTARAWRYRTKSGEQREWLQHQLAHAHNWERVSVWGLCSEVRGIIPAIQGSVAHRLTQVLPRVSCLDCRVLLDREMERGHLHVDEKTLRFEPVVNPPAFAIYERCHMCGGNRETCGHYVGAGAL